MSNYFSSLVLSLLLLVASSHAGKVVKMGDLCKQTKKPLFCLAILKSKATDQKDLNDLAHRAFFVIGLNTASTITLLKSLVANSTNDPNGNFHYKSCFNHFNNGVIGDIIDAEKAFEGGDYLGMSLSISSVLDEVDECVSGDPGDPSFSDPSLVPRYAGNIVLLTDIIIAISNNLRG